MGHSIRNIMGFVVMIALLLSTGMALAQNNTSIELEAQDIPQEEDGGILGAVLADQSVSFAGEGHCGFDFAGEGNGVIHFYLKNTGSKAFWYTLKYPDGHYLFGSAQGGQFIDPGEQHSFTNLPVEAVHGITSHGFYSLDVLNADGSRGNFALMVYEEQK